MMMPFGGISEGILLISLALGYIVFYLSSREEKNTRLIGYFIGIFIMALSLIFIVNNFVLSRKFSRRISNVLQQRPMQNMPMPSPPQRAPQHK
jgi:hypothetical protein